MDSLRGRVLIASPALADPNFWRTVVLVGEHGDEGAMGVVLNRPSQTTVGEAVPDLEGLATSDPVFVGGPVSPTVLIVLARFADGEAGEAMVGEHMGFLPAGEELEDMADSAIETRVFAGYAGWGPGQLEAELEREDWIVATPHEDEVFSDEAEALWPAVLNRLGGRFALLARMPLDPAMN